ncbi:hypothetical protein U9M48_006920, partial [Paspalum notatum var. saurae]
GTRAEGPVPALGAAEPLRTRADLLRAPHRRGVRREVVAASAVLFARDAAASSAADGDGRRATAPSRRRGRRCRSDGQALQAGASSGSRRNLTASETTTRLRSLDEAVPCVNRNLAWTCGASDSTGFEKSFASVPQSPIQNLPLAPTAYLSTSIYSHAHTGQREEKPQEEAMSYSRGSRYESRSPYRRSSYSSYRSRSRSVDSSDAENPGNNLYVTGLSARITDRDLEKHFSTEGEVIDASIVHDPWTRESRGFGFVTMATVKEADRCIKYLDHSVLEGRVITVEKAKRRRGRTPTPGKYLGTKSSRGRRYSPSYSPVRRDGYSSRYSPDRRDRYSSRYSPDRRDRYSSRYSPDRDRSYSPYGRGRPYSPYGRRRSYSPYDRRRSYSPSDRRRSYSPYYSSRYRSRSPRRNRRRRSPSYDRSVSPYYSRCRYRSVSRSSSASPRPRGRSYSRSLSPQRSYSRSCSPGSERSTSYSPKKGHRH